MALTAEAFLPLIVVDFVVLHQFPNHERPQWFFVCISEAIQSFFQPIISMTFRSNIFKKIGI